MLNCCSEFPGVFVPDEEMNCDEDVDLPFIHLHHKKNVSFFSYHKNPLPDNGKQFPLCMNL